MAHGAKAVNQPYLFFPVGIAALVEHSKEQGKCNTLECNSKHKDIDLTEFPVGAVEAQNQSCLDWQKCKYHFGDKVKVQSISGKKSLHAPQIFKAWRIYSRRWALEVVFKDCKTNLGFGKCQSTCFASQITAATLCCQQYNIFPLQNALAITRLSVVSSGRFLER